MVSRISCEGLSPPVETVFRLRISYPSTTPAVMVVPPRSTHINVLWCKTLSPETVYTMTATKALRHKDYRCINKAFLCVFVP